MGTASDTLNFLPIPTAGARVKPTILIAANKKLLPMMSEVISGYISEHMPRFTRFAKAESIDQVLAGFSDPEAWTEIRRSPGYQNRSFDQFPGVIILSDTLGKRDLDLAYLLSNGFYMSPDEFRNASVVESLKTSGLTKYDVLDSVFNRGVHVIAMSQSAHKSGQLNAYRPLPDKLHLLDAPYSMPEITAKIFREVLVPEEWSGAWSYQKENREPEQVRLWQRYANQLCGLPK
jgi:hypothetical protein